MGLEKGEGVGYLVKQLNREKDFKMQLVIHGKDAAELKENLYNAAVAFGATVDPDQIDLPLTPPAALVPTPTTSTLPPTPKEEDDNNAQEPTEKGKIETETQEEMETDPFAETKVAKKAGRPKGATNKKTPKPAAAPKKGKTVTAATAVIETETETEAPVTMKTCQDLLREVNAKCGMPKCRTILGLYDAGRVRDLAKGDYVGFAGACEQALGE